MLIFENDIFKEMRQKQGLEGDLHIRKIANEHGMIIRSAYIPCGNISDSKINIEIRQENIKNIFTNFILVDKNNNSLISLGQLIEIMDLTGTSELCSTNEKYYGILERIKISDFDVIMKYDIVDNTLSIYLNQY